MSKHIEKQTEKEKNLCIFMIALIYKNERNEKNYSLPMFWYK
jgi:hypothetical protein